MRLRWLPGFGTPLATAVAHFSIRTLLRSRQHRVVLSFYLGVAFGLAMFISKAPVVQRSMASMNPWRQPNAPMLAASIIIMIAAVAGARIVFSLPLELRANWVFRGVPLRGKIECLKATRRALLLISATPVWLASAVLFFWLWPWRLAAEHLALLALVGTLIADLSLHSFPKIPFTCSYLPGRSRANVAVLIILGCVLLLNWAAELDQRALEASPAGVCTILAIFAGAAVVARHWTNARAAAPETELRFEEAPSPAIFALDLHRDGTSPV